MIDLNWNTQQGQNTTPYQNPAQYQAPTQYQMPMQNQTPAAQTRTPANAMMQQPPAPESYQEMLDEAENIEEELGEIPPQNGGHTQNNIEMLENPMSVQEAYQTSWKSLLAQNIGRYVVVSFLMGTQQSVVAEGVLYEIGNDYLVLYQPVRDSYITADLYSVKFVEFRAADNRNTINTNQ